MAIDRPVLSPDVLKRSLQRRVLFVVELVDPVTQSIVSERVDVECAGLKGRPIVNYSGRFVWLVEKDAWPTLISVTPGDKRFAPVTAAPPPRPADLEKAKPEERLARITLRPTPVYPFEGVTAIRGRLVEGPETESPAVGGARVQLAWFDHKTTESPDDDEWMLSPFEAETEADGRFAGQFALFLHLDMRKSAEPDIKNGLLKVRLQFTRGGVTPLTRVTPDNYPFIPDSPATEGRVPEGRLLARELTLRWTELTRV